jgi:pimeloyl-ACP methyl ester carboxylesterase
VLNLAVAVAAGALLVWAGALAVLFFHQERLLFPGAPLPADHRFRFAQPYEEIRVPVAGATLDALLFPQPRSRGLVFFLHGNAGNLETWTAGIDFYRRVGWDLFIVDYRGYGRSTGRIGSEAELLADVRAAWDAIAPRYRDRPIVVYGRSLGTGPAAWLARDVKPAMLMLVSPYASLLEAGQRAFPFAPSFLARYPMRTDLVIARVDSPVVLLHGSRDAVIPADDSARLAALARPGAELVVVDGAGHDDIHAFPAYLDAVAERLARVALQ